MKINCIICIVVTDSKADTKSADFSELESVRQQNLGFFAATSDSLGHTIFTYQVVDGAMFK